MAKRNSGLTEKDLANLNNNVDADDQLISEQIVDDASIPSVDDTTTENIPEVNAPKVATSGTEVVLFVKDVERVWIGSAYVSGKKNERRRVSNSVAYYLRKAGLVI